ncbi:DUF2000 domain-containing protein [Kineococcus sp. G2]|uniref:DUF2000 domain-containing protein n=1 Tax=Kineococcus sp. G2 TaxID=3127484 RepID=UPI00301BCD74
MNETTLDEAPVRFDTKIAVLLREDLAAWQRLNVTAFLASGVTAAHPELVGRPYADADGTGYLALLGQPVLVLEGSAQLLRTAHRRAVDRGLPLAVFTAGMFGTGHDAANRAVVAAAPGDRLDLVGIALHGARGRVDKVVKGARLHP